MEVLPVGLDLSSRLSDKVEEKAKKDAAAIETIKASPKQSDTANVGFQDLYKSLSLTAKEIVDKINEKLGIALPGGVQSLRPEDVTPEATADRIVSGVLGLYSVYAKQNQSLQGDALLTGFLDTVKGGIDEGYADAISILENLGAFQFDGVKSGVEKTRSLIDEKLAKFESEKRQELGLQPVAEKTVPPSQAEQVAEA